MAAQDVDIQKWLDMRLSWKIGPSRLDQPELQAELDNDGWVRRFRVRSAAEVLDELIGECIGEVGE